MKNLFLFLIALCFSVMGYAQNDLPKTTSNIDEIKVSPPIFVGVQVQNLYDTENPDLLMKKFLEQNVQFPEEVANCGIEGTEVVRFEITALGEIKNLEIVNSVCPKIDEEVTRVIELTEGMWKPGYNNETPVTMSKEISMPFALGTYPNFRYNTVHDYFTTVATTKFVKANKKLFYKQKPKKALIWYNRAANYLPNDPAILLNRGMCRYEIGDKEGAKVDWERAMQHGCDILLDEMAYDISEMKGYAALLETLKK